MEMAVPRIAGLLQVSTKSVYRWRREWQSATGLTPERHSLSEADYAAPVTAAHFHRRAPGLTPQTPGPRGRTWLVA